MRFTFQTKVQHDDGRTGSSISSPCQTLGKTMPSTLKYFGTGNPPQHEDLPTFCRLSAVIKMFQTVLRWSVVLDASTFCEAFARPMAGWSPANHASHMPPVLPCPPILSHIYGIPLPPTCSSSTTLFGELSSSGVHRHSRPISFVCGRSPSF